MYVKQDLYVCVFFLFVFTEVGTSAKSNSDDGDAYLRRFYIDVGRNLSLPCPTQPDKDVMWVREGRRQDQQAPRLTIEDDGSLSLVEVDGGDSGVYSCTPANAVGEDKTVRMRVIVRTPPPPLVRVRVSPSTILSVIMWELNGTGGYPITYFSAQFRLADSEEPWQEISPIHIPPSARQIDVYKLEPNTTYAFRVWAANQLGESNMTTVYSTTTMSIEDEQLRRHFLQGIEKFDTRVWVIAVAIVMGTLVVLGLGTCFLLYQECRVPGDPEDQEVIELVPNIILNPGFEGDVRTERVPSDENSNNETTTRLNNNTVVQPRNL